MKKTDEYAAIPDGFVAAESGGAFARTAGPFFLPASGGAACVAMRAFDRHANPLDWVHGGALMTLADQASGAEASIALGRDARFATVSLNCDFLAPARPGDWIEAEGEVVRRTRSLIFTHVRVRTGETLLMTASGIWKILNQDGE